MSDPFRMLHLRHTDRRDGVLGPVITLPMVDADHGFQTDHRVAEAFRERGDPLVQGEAAEIARLEERESPDVGTLGQTMFQTDELREVVEVVPLAAHGVHELPRREVDALFGLAPGEGGLLTELPGQDAPTDAAERRHHLSGLRVEIPRRGVRHVGADGLGEVRTLVNGGRTDVLGDGAYDVEIVTHLGPPCGPTTRPGMGWMSRTQTVCHACAGLSHTAQHCWSGLLQIRIDQRMAPTIPIVPPSSDVTGVRRGT